MVIKVAFAQYALGQKCVAHLMTLVLVAYYSKIGCKKVTKIKLQPNHP